MEIIKIIGIALTALVIIIMLKQYRPEYAVFISILTCSADLREFIAQNHLDLSLDSALNPRDAFGSHDDADHVYNTPRAWYMLRYLNPRRRGGGKPS